MRRAAIEIKVQRVRSDDDLLLVEWILCVQVEPNTIAVIRVNSFFIVVAVLV